MGEPRYSSVIFDLGSRWMWMVGFTPRSLYIRKKSSQYPLDRLGGPQNRSGHCGDEKNLVLPGIEIGSYSP
jgi:hypothetical protein